MVTDSKGDIFSAVLVVFPYYREKAEIKATINVNLNISVLASFLADTGMEMCLLVIFLMI